VKISQAGGNATFPKLLSYSDVPAKIVLRSKSEIVSENFVLTAWWTESRRHIGMQYGVSPVDLVAAGDTIRPYAAELIEVIEPAAGDKDQILDRCERGLQESGDFFGVIAYEGWLRSEDLQNERAFLPGINAAVKES
jgi:hypothetical protein